MRNGFPIKPGSSGREGGKLRPAGWDEALALAAEKLSGDAGEIAAIAGDLCDAESMKALKDLMDSLGVKNIDCRQDGSSIGGGNRQDYLFKTTIAGIEDADAILIIGSNPRLEAPLVNTRIRKAWISGNTEIGLIGAAADLTYDYEHTGTKPGDIAKIAKGGKGFAKAFMAAKKPVVIIGADVFTREDAPQILNAVSALAKKSALISEGWNGFNILHKAASRVAGLDLGFLPGEGGLATADMMAGARSGAIKTVYLLGADEMDMSALKDAFVIYQGSHGDAGAHVADIILPAAAYTEKDGLYTNMEGRVQMGSRAVPPKGDAKEDWAIIRALSGHMGRALPYDSLSALRESLFADHPVFAGIGYAPGADGAAGFQISGAAGKISI